MDVILFGLLNFIAFFFLILGVSRKDIAAGAVSFCVFLIIGYLVLIGGITSGFALDGYSFITASNCSTLVNVSTNCTYSVNATSASVSDSNLIGNDTIQIGIVALYLLFALYLGAVFTLSAAGRK